MDDGYTEYKLKIANELRERLESEGWIPVEGVKFTFHGDEVELLFASNLAAAIRNDAPKKVVVVHDESSPIRWR